MRAVIGAMTNFEDPDTYKEAYHFLKRTPSLTAGDLPSEHFLTQRVMEQRMLLDPENRDLHGSLTKGYEEKLERISRTEDTESVSSAKHGITDGDQFEYQLALAKGDYLEKVNGKNKWMLRLLANVIFMGANFLFSHGDANGHNGGMHNSLENPQNFDLPKLYQRSAEWLQQHNPKDMEVAVRNLSLQLLNQPELQQIPWFSSDMLEAGIQAALENRELPLYRSPTRGAAPTVEQAVSTADLLQTDTSPAHLKAAAPHPSKEKKEDPALAALARTQAASTQKQHA
jgi:hypothetical protein